MRCQTCQGGREQGVLLFYLECLPKAALIIYISLPHETMCSLRAGPKTIHSCIPTMGTKCLINICFINE